MIRQKFIRLLGLTERKSFTIRITEVHQPSDVCPYGWVRLTVDDDTPVSLTANPNGEGDRLEVHIK